MVNRTIFLFLLLLSVPLYANAAASVNLPRTGQNLCYDANGAINCAGTGQDGETQTGVVWPTPRFTLNNNGTVTDNLSNLTWLTDAKCLAINGSGGKDWFSALAAANTLASGQCGLSDGSGAGDWRLPNVNELESLIDLSQSNPPLPTGHPFINVPQGPDYWSSTVTAVYPTNAEGVDMFTGTVRGDIKTALKYVWPVKGTSNLPQTGQATCWETSGTPPVAAPCNGSRADGDLKMGVAWPIPRFVGTGNGTITDNLTGLTWLQKGNCFSFSNISTQGQAITAASTLANGSCGLTDGSVQGDWRLANRKEMRSLFSYEQPDGAAWLNATDQGFLGVNEGWYRTSDSYPIPPFTSDKWMVKSEGGNWLSVDVMAPQNPPQAPPYYFLPVRGVLKVQHITFSSPPGTLTYLGPDFDLSTIATGGASLKPVTFSVASGPGTVAPATTLLHFTGGGDIVVKASEAGDTNYYPAGDAFQTIHVNKALGSVTLVPESLTQTYDGTVKLPSVTTVPPDLYVTATYNGSATPPSNAGGYAIVATISNDNYQGSTTGTLNITKAPCTVTLDTASLSQTYNGSPRSATATTSPTGKTVSYTYNGSSAAPTNAGSYPVVATITDINYQGSPVNGTLVIAKAPVTLTLGGLGQTYDGTPKSATATTSPSGKTVSLTYAGNATAPTNAGSYPVVATVSDTNFQGSGTGTLVIAKATPTITWATPAAIISGTALSSTQLNATASQPGSFVYTPLSGSVPASGTQVLSVVFTPTDGANYTTATASTNLVVNLSVTFAAGNNGGTVTGSTSQSVGLGGSTTQVTAVPTTGHHFVNWTGTGGFVTSTANPLTVTNITASQVITANFAGSATGDCNGDGIVDVADALMALRIAVKLVPMDAKYLGGDVTPMVNGVPQPDGVIDVSDALMILRKCVGLVNF